MNTSRFSVEVPVPVPTVELEQLTLRSFTWRLNPLREQLAPAGEHAAGIVGPVNGLELVLAAELDGRPCQVSVRFDRSEFVNIATGGMAVLDAADATDNTERR